MAFYLDFVFNRAKIDKLSHNVVYRVLVFFFFFFFLAYWWVSCISCYKHVRTVFGDCILPHAKIWHPRNKPVRPITYVQPSEIFLELTCYRYFRKDLLLLESLVMKKKNRIGSSVYADSATKLMVSTELIFFRCS